MANTLGVGPAFGSCAPGSSFTINLNGVTAGRGVVVLIVWQDAGGARTVSSVPVAGQTATLITGSKADATSGVDHVQCAFLNNVTISADKDITVNFSGSVYATGVAVEVAGLDTAASVEAFLSAASATPSTPITGSITTATANASIFAVTTAPGTMSAGTNFTLLSNPRTNNGYNDEDEYWLDAGGNGSKTVSFATADAGAFWILSAIAVKTAGVTTTPKTFTGADSLAGGELL